MFAAIRAIRYHLPQRVLSNAELESVFDSWSAEKIEAKTGIAERRIAADEECASDLAVAAARQLFEDGACDPREIDFLLLCTQSPDYLLPTTACLLQDRLGLPTSAGALDFNLGCSGYVYGLGLAKALVETGQARRVLFLTAETYSKYLHPHDRSVRTLFGDGAAATLIAGVERPGGSADAWIGPFVYGTDGRGGENLIVASGGTRRLASTAADSDHADRPPADCLFMDGPEIMAFTLQVVPTVVDALLSRSGLRMDEIDLFVFHQANQFLLEHLREALAIPRERFPIALRHCGNTVSSTLPITLKEAERAGRLKPGDRVMLVGFGVGYSWGATIVRWA